MQETRKLTTDEVREAYRGLLVPTGEYTYEFIDEETADREFDLWLYTERNRVAELAMAKERERIIKLLEANHLTAASELIEQDALGENK